MMFSMPKEKHTLEIIEDKIKKLRLYETVEGKRNDLFCTPSYTRVPGGLIRTVTMPEGVTSCFITVPNTYFITN